ncbi:MAG: hypothetical protein WBA93_36225 [Microcoleaceae cyanobacterium]
MNNIQSISLSHKTVERVKYIFLAFLFMVFFLLFVFSFSWRVRGDSVYLHYTAYLINEHGFLPYRDIFEINMPGTYLFHMAVGKMFGYSDYALRMANIAWLTATFVVTWLIMKPFGRITAFASCLLFGILYLGFGPSMSLQREFIAILPIATALLLTIRRKPNHSVNLINFLIGVLFAFVALIKPPLIVGFPAIIIYNCIDDTNDFKSIKKLIKPLIVGGLFALAGFLLTLIIPFLWLWRIGTLQTFWDISSSYTPLYAQMSGDLQFRDTFSHVQHILSRFQEFKHFGILFIASIFGVYFVFKRSTSVDTKKLSILLLVLSICYTIYASSGGKVWLNYFLPYMYFASLGTAIVLYSPALFAKLYRPNIIPVLVFIISSIIVLEYNVFPKEYITFPKIQIQPKQKYEIKAEKREDEIVAYLNDNLSPTDKVQPLSWAQGTIEAMLASKAVLATPYIADFQFYHHVSNPYIQTLRQDFITKLEEEMPRFIIDVYADRKISGLDTSYEFPELKDFIKQHYYKDYTGSDFDIYRRRDDS